MTALAMHTSSSSSHTDHTEHNQHHHIDLAMLDTIVDGEAVASFDKKNCRGSILHNLEEGSLKRSGSVGGHTLATMATESDYSFSDLDKTLKSAHEDMEDSLSSQDETSVAEAIAAETEEDSVTLHSDGNAPAANISKIPSSLHIPSVHKEPEESTEDSQEGTILLTSFSALEESQAGENISSSSAQDDDAETVTTAPRRKAIQMTPYKPTNRSIAVAQSPARPSLRRHSSYGKDSTIPLNFNKRRSVLVLPKPNLQTLLGRDRLATTMTEARAPQRHTVPAQRRSVQFDKICIREHAITMGDNPSCSYGTPISLDWDYLDFEELSLEDYEMHKFASGRGRPRTLRQLYLNHYQRLHRLQQEGYTPEEIRARKHETNKVRKQREMTRFLAQAKVLVTLEDLVESAGRKVKRTMGKSSRKEQERQLLLKVMEGDDTVDTAQINRSERISSNSERLMPLSIRPIDD